MASSPKVVPLSGQQTSVTTNEQDKRAARQFQARLASAEGGDGATLTIRSGDTLHKIAAQAGIELEALLAANTQFDANSVDGIHHWSKKAHGKRDADDLRLGERIVVPVAPQPKAGDGSVVGASASSGQQRVVKVHLNEGPQRNSGAETALALSRSGVSEAGTAAFTTLNDNPVPAPPEPDPVLVVNDKDHKHLLMVTAGGSGSKDPKGADNRIGLNLESLDNSVNPNNGTYQLGMALTSPGRVQEPLSRLDLTARMTLFSLGRKPLKTTDAQGKEQSIETFGAKLGSMTANNRFMSVSAYANLSGLPIGSITQENGTAIAGKSATSPAHLGVAASVGSLNGFYAFGLGYGQTRNTATDTKNFNKTDIYGADLAVPFDFGGKIKLDKAHVGMTGRRTVTTPENGTAGEATYSSSAFIESYFKIGAGKMNSLLPGQASSPKVNATGVFRARLDMSMAARLDPRVTLRYDQPLWEVRNTTKGPDGALNVTSQMRIEAMSSMQFGVSSVNKPAVQNFTIGLRAKF